MGDFLLNNCKYSFHYIVGIIAKLFFAHPEFLDFLPNLCGIGSRRGSGHRPTRRGGRMVSLWVWKKW